MKESIFEYHRVPWGAETVQRGWEWIPVFKGVEGAWLLPASPDCLDVAWLVVRDWSPEVRPHLFHPLLCALWQVT